MEKKKMLLNSPLWRKASSANVSASDEIPTPEKPAQSLRRAGERKLSFSVSDVRKVAMGLRMTRNTSTNPSDLDQPRSDGERQRKSKSSSDSATMLSAARKTTKLSENYEMLAEFFNCLDSLV